MEISEKFKQNYKNLPLLSKDPAISLLDIKSYIKEPFTLAYLLSYLLKPEMKSTVRQVLNECKNNNAFKGQLFSLKEKVLLFGTAMVSLAKTRLSRINKA